MNILLVDDNQTNPTIMETILNHEGYTETVKMASAIELLEYFNLAAAGKRNAQVDLILMDMMMPEIDGIEACRIIQRMDELKDIPIIIVTAFGESNKLAEALDAGAVDFVTKPINKIELLARIRVALRLKHETNLHKERDRKIVHELELAKQVQQSVLKAPFSNHQLSIETAYHPSFELAGDIYAWYPIDERRYAVILLDVMGHGISSSLVGMYIYSVLRDIIIREVEPGAVTKELNRHMNRLNTNQSLMLYYCTAIYMVIDFVDNHVEYVNAGHPPGVVLQPESEHPVLLDKGSCALGLYENIEIVPDSIDFESASCLYIFTDGLIELFEQEHSEVEGLQSLIQSIQDNRNDSLRGYMNEILPHHPDLQKDDVCMLRIQLM